MPAANFPRQRPVSAEEVREALQLDWQTTIKRVGAGAFEDRLGAVDRDTLGNVLKGKHSPRLHTAVNSLLADRSALLNTLLLFGVVAIEAEPGEIDDHEVIAGMLRTAAEYFDRMKDGRRCHTDTLALAELFGPLIGPLLAIVREGARIRGSA